MQRLWNSINRDRSQASFAAINSLPKQVQGYRDGAFSIPEDLCALIKLALSRQRDRLIELCMSLTARKEMLAIDLGFGMSGARIFRAHASRRPLTKRMGTCAIVDLAVATMTASQISQIR
jgi:hypothetical protein